MTLGLHCTRLSSRVRRPRDPSLSAASIRWLTDRRKEFAVIDWHRQLNLAPGSAGLPALPTVRRLMVEHPVERRRATSVEGVASGSGTPDPAMTSPRSNK